MSAEPMMPAEREPNRTAILPAERSVSVALGSSAPNERVSTKMAIVNPMPPRHATANSIFHDAPSGMAPIFNLIAKNDANVIPSGLPNNKEDTHTNKSSTFNRKILEDVEETDVWNDNTCIG